MIVRLRLAVASGVELFELAAVLYLMEFGAVVFVGLIAEANHISRAPVMQPHNDPSRFRLVF